MLNENQINSVAGRDVYGNDGDKIGSAGQFYLDENGQPQWLSVKTGLFGMKESFVPLAQAEIIDEDCIRVPYTKDEVKAAPSIDPDRDMLSADEESQLYSHFGRSNEYTDWRQNYSSSARSTTTGPKSDEPVLRLRRYQVTERRSDGTSQTAFASEAETDTDSTLGSDTRSSTRR